MYGGKRGWGFEIDFVLVLRLYRGGEGGFNMEGEF